jgi:hypothetical protein
MTNGERKYFRDRKIIHIFVEKRSIIAHKKKNLGEEKKGIFAPSLTIKIL